jgi:hypothetical protein
MQPYRKDTKYSKRAAARAARLEANRAVFFQTCERSRTKSVHEPSGSWRRSSSFLIHSRRRMSSAA